MALLASEVARVRVELGYNALSGPAEPYIGYTAIFDQVIQQYLSAGATTTSSTSVTAVTPPGAPAPVALTLVSATGFEAGAVVWIDVDARQERAIVESLSGSVITVMLAKDHAGTYPVTVEGGETMVREILSEIAKVKAKIGSVTLSTAGLKRADEVEWYPGQFGMSSALAGDVAALDFWRNELAIVLGVQNMRQLRAMQGAYAVNY